MRNNDIAAMLMSKYGLPKKEAQNLVSAMIDVVNDGLRQDRLVKVKGLGTFKMTSVSARESVDVNTGERILLNEREKITFTPDAVIRDLVNKPFSYFETVILNDGVDFSDLEENTEKETCNEVETQPLPVQESVQEIIPEPVSEPASEPSSEPELESSFVLQPYIHVPEEASGSEEMNMEEGSLPSTTSNKFEVLFYVTLFLLLVTLSVSGGLGYYVYERYIHVESELAEKVETPLMTDNSPKAEATQKVEQPEKIEESSKTEVAETDETLETAPKIEVAETPTKVEQPQKPTLSSIPDQSAYEGDPRVRLGAYYIMGIAQTITVQKGQTFTGISKAYLGPGMDCYLEAVNKGVKEVKEGQKLRIPALKSKKSMRRK